VHAADNYYRHQEKSSVDYSLLLAWAEVHALSDLFLLSPLWGEMIFVVSLLAVDDEWHCYY
jgi:hypothetical protein